MVSSSDTGAFTEGQTVSTFGNFSQIPDPKTWSNGDDLLPGTLNHEWRDTFNWMLRGTSPAFFGTNQDGGSLTFTSGAAIAIKVESLKRGNLQHASNDSKVYVYEPGRYLALVHIGINTSSATGSTFTSILRKNGALETSGDQTRNTGGLMGVNHMSSVDLVSGDYVEIALGGGWTGTATAGTAAGVYPSLYLWWRSN